MCAEKLERARVRFRLRSCYDCGVRDVYTNPENMGGCSDTCQTASDGICTDGGEGSYRRFQEVPTGVSGTAAFNSKYNDLQGAFGGYVFDCEYGSE